MRKVAEGVVIFLVGTFALALILALYAFPSAGNPYPGLTFFDIWKVTMIVVAVPAILAYIVKEGR